MAVYKETIQGVELLTRSKSIPEVVAIVQEGKRLAGLPVSPCIKDNLKVLPVSSDLSNQDII